MRRTPQRIDRRNLFFSSGALAAGALLLDEATAQADNPAAGVADRLTTLKITNLKAMRAGAKAYVKLETNQGITGWGEVSGLDPTVACALAESAVRNCSRTRIPRASNIFGSACIVRIAISAAGRT